MLRGWRRGSATEMLQKGRQRGRVCGVGSLQLDGRWLAARTCSSIHYAGRVDRSSAGRVAH